jgi:hypothetical protein
MKTANFLSEKLEELAKPISGRGLQSYTTQLNLSRF